MSATIRTAAAHNADPMISFNLKFRTDNGSLYKVGYVVTWPCGTMQYVSNKRRAETLSTQTVPKIDQHLPELLF